MKFNVKRHIPLLVSIGVLLGLVAFSVGQIYARNQGHFIYALDDAYIHMAIARNLFEHGIWGVSSFGFSSAGSSLLFPSLIALGFKLFGEQEFLPLFINIGAALGILSLAAWILQRHGANWRISLGTLLLIIIASPIPYTIAVGMEHTLHSLVSLGFCYLAVEILVVQKTQAKTIAGFFALSFLLSATRYEGLFMIALVCALLSLRWRILLALGTAFSGSIGIILFGFYSLSQGSLFLPNSVYLKGGVANANGLWGQIERLLPTTILANLHETFVLWPILFMLSLAGILIFINKNKGLGLWWTKLNLLGVILIGSIILHVQFSMFMHIRYEMYLVTLLILVTALFITEINLARQDFHWLVAAVWALPKRFTPYRWIVIVLLCIPILFSLLFYTRRAIIYKDIPDHASDIYAQHYQMALFIRQYYPDTPFALNDIGAVSFLNNIPILDLWGLASVEIAREGGYKRIPAETAWDIFEAQQVHHAIIYDEWMQRLIPPDWIEVGSWQLEAKHSAAFETVHFYVATALEANKLLANLRQFEDSLPPQVQTNYSYP